VSAHALANHRATSDELEGRVILVTGASDGIGKAVAMAAAACGAELILLGRNLPRLTATYEAICSAQGEVATRVQMDFETAVAQDYDRIAAAVIERYGRLDGLVHCAAQLGSLTPLDQYDVPVWCRLLHVNVTAAFALTQVLMPALRASKDASVLFTSSSVGRRGKAYWGAYAVSKSALEGFSEVLADETQGNSAIRVNTINPGRARTKMRRQAYPSEALESLPEPASLTGLYLALLGPAGVGITGQRLDCQ
jgi:NAD(P)-dependent dehydrogenase (short-subunit alcohol dehydrogenase family)